MNRTIFLWFAIIWLPLQASSKDHLIYIQKKLDTIVNAAEKDVHIGVKILSAKTGLCLYEKNSTQLFIPASCAKIFTAGAALHYLGPYHTFPTYLLTEGQIEKTTLKGNLYFQGNGDPSFTLKDLEQLVLKLQLHNIKEIEGDLVIDNFAFDEFSQGPGWMWDDVHHKCYSPANALTINHNCVEIFIQPAEKVDAAPKVFVYPNTSFAKIENQATTGQKDKKINVKKSLTALNNTICVKGTIGLGTNMQTFTVPIKGPHLYAATLLRLALKKRGITYTGKIRLQKAPSSTTILAEHTSASLHQLLQVCIKESDNLYADNIFKATGAFYAKEQGNWKNGSQAVRNHLENDAKLTIGHLVHLDGCGLSRYNLASADHFTTYLSWVYKDFRYMPEFLSLLSLSGKDGTAKGRLQKEPSFIRAKSGTMSGVSTLCGFLETKNKEPLVFAILINGFTEKSTHYKAEIEDKICSFLLQLTKEELTL